MSKRKERKRLEEERYYNTVIAELPMLHDGSGQSWMRNPLPPEEVPVPAEAKKVEEVKKPVEAKPEVQAVKDDHEASKAEHKEKHSKKDDDFNSPILIDSQKPLASYNDTDTSVLRANPFSLFFHKLWWGFLLLITLFILYPVVQCKKERYFAKRTKINGHQLKFEGRAISLFGHYMLWWLLTIVTFGIFSFWLEKKMRNWKAARMNFEGADEEAKGGYNGSAILLALLRLALGLFSIVTALIMLPQCICWEKKYICNHTSYKGRRLCFDGKGIALFGRSLLWLLLTIITIGIFGFWVPLRYKRWFASHTYFQGAPRK